MPYSYPIAGMYGDPGFFGAIGRVFKGIGKVAAGVAGIPLPGPKAPKIPVALPAQMGKVIQGIPRQISGVVQKIPKGVIPALGGAAAGAIGAGGLTAAMMGGGGRRRRRMRVTNVKALRRSIRRCQGFAKLAKRVLRFTSPRPPRGRAVFKKRARKAV